MMRIKNLLTLTVCAAVLLTSCGTAVTETSETLTTSLTTEEKTTRISAEDTPKKTEMKPVKYENAVPETPLPGAKYTVTDLGNFTKTIYNRNNHGGYLKDGTPVLYFVCDSVPQALFVVTHAQTGEVLMEKKLAHSTGAWQIFTHSSKDVYIVGHGTPYLYVFRHDTEEIEEIGTLPHGSTLGQGMCEDKNGVIYSGTTDTNYFWAYDHNAKKFVELPVLLQNATRYPSVAYDAVENMVYVSVLSKDSKNYLFRYDPDTKKYTDVTPAKYKNDASFQFYDIKIYGDVIIIRYPSTQKTVYYNIRTMEQVGFHKKNYASSAPDPDNFKTYARHSAAVPDDPTKFYSVIEGEIAVFDTVKLEYVLTGTKATTNYIRMVCLKLDQEKYPGYSICGLYSHKGKVQFSNLEKKQTVVITTTVSGQPNEPNCLTITKNGVLYIGGGYGGSTGTYNVKTGEKAFYDTLSQQEGITAYGNKVYIGTYPTAGIYFHNSLVPWNVTSILNMGKSTEIPNYHNQDRPYTFIAAPDKKIMAAFTVPAQSFTTGAMAFFNADNGSLLYQAKFPIENQSAVSGVYYDGIMYLGTTVRAGYGTTALSDRACIIAYDVDNKTYERIDIPQSGIHAVTAMTVTKDGVIWGFGYNLLFKYIISEKKFEFVKKMPIACGNQVYRDLTVSLSADEKVLFVSSHTTMDFYRYDIDTGSFSVIAKDVGWHHVSDNYGRFYFLKDTGINCLEFENQR